MNEDKTTPVAIKTADSEPTIVYIFTLIAMCCFGLDTGFLPGECLILLGLLQIGVLPIYIIGAYNIIKRNNPLIGNCFMMFAATFGGVGGLCNIFTYFSSIFNWPLSTKIMGVIWIWAGFILLPVAFGSLRGPLFPFIVFASGSIQFILLGLNILFFSNPILSFLVTICEGITGFVGLYCWVAAMFSFTEYKLPFGPILKKK